MFRVLDETENPLGYAVDFRRWLAYMGAQGVTCQKLFNVCWQIDSDINASFQ